MSRFRLTLFFVVELALAAAPLARVARAAPGSGKTRPSPSSRTPVELAAPPPATTGETRCELCHSEAGWGKVRFAHDRTGFPLRGAHEQVECTRCHVDGYKRKLPDRCGGCHRDAHAGEFGLRCDGCHDEKSWRTTFTADAHRRGNFPLSGRHALIPCTECHREVRDRGFGRAAVDCFACHQADYQRAAMVSIDHARAGFGTACASCHNPFRFFPAAFPAHDRCFQMTGGPHVGIRCLGCHTSLGGAAQVTGACLTMTASCTRCHEHACARTDARHTGVPGYQCKDRKCYECHRFAR